MKISHIVRYNANIQCIFAFQFLENPLKSWYKKNAIFLKSVFFPHPFKEPINSIAPKISVADEFSVRGVHVRIGNAVSIQCQAMAYPSPIFR